MVNIGMAWLRSKPSLTFTERAGSPRLVKINGTTKKGEVGFRFFLTIRLLF